MWLYNSCYLERKKLASLICHNCDRLFVIIPNIRHSFLLLWWKSTDLLSKCVKWYLNRLFRGLLFKYQKRKKTAVMSLILIKGSTTVKGAVRWSSFVFMFRLKLTGFSWVSQLMFLLLLKLLSEPHCPSSLLCGCFLLPPEPEPEPATHVSHCRSCLHHNARIDPSLWTVFRRSQSWWTKFPRCPTFNVKMKVVYIPPDALMWSTLSLPLMKSLFLTN